MNEVKSITEYVFSSYFLSYTRRAYTDCSASCSALVSDELIVIAVTNTSKEYQVQKAILCDASDYFTKALNGQSAEALSRRITLPNADADTVKLLVYWLVRKDLPDLEYEKLVHEWSIKLARLWVLGGQLKIARLQDKVLSHLVSLWQAHTIDVYTAKEICELAPRDSRLYELTVREVAIQYTLDEVGYVRLDPLHNVPGFLVAFSKNMRGLNYRICDSCGRSRRDDAQDARLRLARYDENLDAEYWGQY